jgi:hypothetical protein
MSVRVISIRNNKEGQQCDRVGDRYTTRFPQRHPTTVARSMNRDRVLAVNAKSLDEYFERLNECITRNHIDPSDIWNFNDMRHGLHAAPMRAEDFFFA